MWLARRGERWRDTSISAISDEPPPMSNSTTPSVSRSTSEPQPDTASRASVWRSMISSFSPASRSTRSRNSAPFSAERQASVAISRARVILRLRSLSPQIFSASTARSIAGCAEPAGGGQALAQPDDARKRIDDAELPGPAGNRDQQPAIVGAEIERRESRQIRYRRAGAMARSELSLATAFGATASGRRLVHSRRSRRLCASLLAGCRRVRTPCVRDDACAFSWSCPCFARHPHWRDRGSVARRPCGLAEGGPRLAATIHPQGHPHPTRQRRLRGPSPCYFLLAPREPFGRCTRMSSCVDARLSARAPITKGATAEFCRSPSPASAMPAGPIGNENAALG